jgi:septin 7
MLDVEEPPSLEQIPVDHHESMEHWVADKLRQASRNYSSTSKDWADILPLYTAANGAPAAPSRASPIPNGAPSSPLEIPMTVSSSDPKIAAQQASDMKNIVRRKLTGYVGFANLPNQWHRKSVRKGFNFNVMVVGKWAF